MTAHATSLDQPVQPRIVDADGAFTRRYERGLALTDMQDNAWRRPRFYHLAQMFALTRGVPGATAEAGVYRGLASYVLCEMRRAEDPGFDGVGHFAIDSFEGLSEPTEADEHPGYAGRFADTSLEIAQKTLADFPGATLVKGWIPEAFDELPEQTYRFVHVDVDLHDPTMDSLAYFYPRLSAGGVLVIDDYGPWPNGDFPGCKLAVDAFAAGHGLSIAVLDTGNAVLVKR